MVKVWGRTNSINVQKVMWAVAELGLACERIDAGGAFGGLAGAEYGARNPNRLIPVVEDEDGTTVWESNSCVRYLAARHGAGSWWPETPVARAEADRWMDWQLTTLQPAIGPIFINLVRTPEPQRDMAAVAAGAERIAAAWLILDRHLAGRRYVAGDAGPTMGDIPVGCVWWRYANLAVAKPDLPHLERWFGELKVREPYRRHVMLPLT